MSPFRQFLSQRTVSGWVKLLIFLALFAAVACGGIFIFRQSYGPFTVVSFAQLTLPSQKDDFFYSMAEALNDPDMCAKITWSAAVDAHLPEDSCLGCPYHQNFIRSQCYSDIAFDTGDPKLCDKVVGLIKSQSEIGDVSKSSCLASIGLAHSDGQHRVAMNFDTATNIRNLTPLLEELGYSPNDVEASMLPNENSTLASDANQTKSEEFLANILSEKAGQAALTLFKQRVMALSPSAGVSMESPSPPTTLQTGDVFKLQLPL